MDNVLEDFSGTKAEQVYRCGRQKIFLHLELDMTAV